MILSTASLSSITEAPSIFEDVDDALGTDATSYPLARKLRDFNKAYRKIGLWIWLSQKTWKFKDSNDANLLQPTKTLVADQLDYSIPTNALSIEWLELLDTSGNYVRITRVPEFSNIPENDANGFPTEWRLEGTAILLNKKVNSSYVTLASGMRIGVSKGITNLTKADSAVSPGFIEEFHELISKLMQRTFCLDNNMFDKAKEIFAEIAMMKNDLESYYQQRDTSSLNRINPKRTSYI
jgi:hypothetical protein